MSDGVIYSDRSSDFFSSNNIGNDRLIAWYYNLAI